MFQYMAGCEPRSRAIASVASAIFYNQGQCCISRRICAMVSVM
jgi:acyl-CoA reductase-like NAD-dependent aldehyde dehydrogenase